MNINSNTYLEIIDTQYLLLHHLPQQVEQEPLLEFMSKWKVPYIATYTGFLLTKAQTKGFRRQLYDRFGILYDDPPIDFQQNIFPCQSLPLLSQIMFENQKQGHSEIYSNFRWIIPQQISNRFDLCIQILKNSSREQFCCIIITKQETRGQWHQALALHQPTIQINSDFYEFYPYLMQCGQFRPKQRKYLILGPQQLEQLKLLQNKQNCILIYQNQFHTLSDIYLLLIRDFGSIFLLPSKKQEEKHSIKIKMICLLANKEPASYIKSRYVRNGNDWHELQLNKVINSYRLEKDIEEEKGEETERKRKKHTKSILKKQKASKSVCLKKVRFQIC